MALGHGGFRLSGANGIGLVDPWLDRDGAYLGSWHQLPDNGHLLTPELLAPNWVALSSAGDDRCDIATLSRLPSGTPVFVPAGDQALVARLRTIALQIVEVPPTASMTLNDGGSRLTFLVDDSGGSRASSVMVTIDGVSALLCSPFPPDPLRMREQLPQDAPPPHLIAVCLARVARDPLCVDASVAAKRRRSAEIRSAVIERACDAVVASEAPVVMPYGGPPCFLDPELGVLNQSIEPPGVLPDPAQAAAILRTRLPTHRTIELLPGDRYFPVDELILNDPFWRDFSFARLQTYLFDYAYKRAVNLSRVHSRFLPPGASLGAAFKASLEARVVADRDLRDHVRFEVSGPGGGIWDVMLDQDGIRVDLSGRASAPAARIRIASHWLAPAIDGRASWRQVLSSLRFSIARAPGRHDEPLLDLLERSAVATGSTKMSTPSR